MNNLTNLILGIAGSHLGWFEQREASPVEVMTNLARDRAWDKALRMAKKHNLTLEGDDHGCAPLLVIAVAQNQEKVAMDLLGMGSNPNAVSKSGRPVLVLAIERCADEMALALIDAGADMDVCTRAGTPALAIAMRYRKADLTLAMIKRGARVGKRVVRKSSSYLKRLDEGTVALLERMGWPRVQPNIKSQSEQKGVAVWAH